MKQFLLGMGIILLLIIASFSGDIMREAGMGEVLIKYIFLGSFAVLSYYVIKQKEQITKLQQDMENKRKKMKKLNDSFWFLELKAKGKKPWTLHDMT
jgi:hypothetical protein